MKIPFKVLFLLAFPAAALAEPELHRGGVSFGFNSVDGDTTLFGTAYSYDGDTSGIGGHYYVTETVSISLAKTEGDYDYGASTNNLTCDINGTSISASFHPKRTNLFTGEGNGYSFGIQTTDSDVDCEDNNFYYDTVSSDDQHFIFNSTRGLGDALTLSAGFMSNTDDFLDDRSFSFGLTKVLDGNFAASLGIAIAETAEDTDGDNTEFTMLSFSGQLLF